MTAGDLLTRGMYRAAQLDAAISGMASAIALAERCIAILDRFRPRMKPPTAGWFEANGFALHAAMSDYMMRQQLGMQNTEMNQRCGLSDDSLLRALFGRGGLGWPYR